MSRVIAFAFRSGRKVSAKWPDTQGNKKVFIGDGSVAGHSDLAGTISDESAREAMREFRKTAIHPDAIGRAIRYAIEQPPEVDVSEIIARPTASPH